MLILKGCVAVAALAHAVTAFHPWYPDYRCKELHTCQSEKRAARNDAEAGKTGGTLRIVQRLPQVIELLLTN